LGRYIHAVGHVITIHALCNCCCPIAQIINSIVPIPLLLAGALPIAYQYDCITSYLVLALISTMTIPLLNVSFAFRLKEIISMDIDKLQPGMISTLCQSGCMHQLALDTR
jgi:hypothetical protein